MYEVTNFALIIFCVSYQTSSSQSEINFEMKFYEGTVESSNTGLKKQTILFKICACAWDYPEIVNSLSSVVIDHQRPYLSHD